MSKPGAIEVPAEHESPAATENVEPAHAAGSGGVTPADSAASFFIPDFCATRMVFALVLISELLALTLTLARPGADFLTELARVSLFLQWLGLTSAALLCYTRPRLARLTVPMASVAVFVLLLVNTALISEAALWFGSSLTITSGLPTLFPRDHWSFLLRNEGICLIVAAMLLRYFFVTHQWRRHVRAEARSRIEALQARIRPHFLFNSMNTIASLTRSDPKRAEEAVEDLADLFRATLRDSMSTLRLKEELELSRIYQRIEELRLGDRLKVRWDVAELPMRGLIPGLTVQPLLENAIYHGIEPLDRGGTVTVSGHVANGEVEITVANPVAGDRDGVDRPGNRLAMENIRQRLALAYGNRGSLRVEARPDEYRVTIRFPYEE
jgi:two-component system sensor histidine kinase AlgZ